MDVVGGRGGSNADARVACSSGCCCNVTMCAFHSQVRVVAFVVVVVRYLYYGANATENITLLRTLAGPGSTGVNGRLRPIR